MSSNVRWLTTTPAGDLNFVNALKRATDDEIKEAISQIEAVGGKNKTKLLACNRELRRRAKK